MKKLKEKVIVTTTINPPTEALVRFSRMEGWDLLVVGDLRTPHELFTEIDCHYYSPEAQERDFPQLSSLIGWKTIQRRNLGFLFALTSGARVVATVDDDNIPFDFWGTDLFVGDTMILDEHESELVFDPISVTNYPNLWHRGFPIQRLQRRKSTKKKTEKHLSVQADFWNGDPDIDAICRMEHSPNCKFSEAPFPFSASVFSPFNSQNTFLTRDALKHYFMFPGIGRMDDIWASYYLQALGYDVGYSRASVFQERNAHDLTQDFEGEIIGYLKTEEMLTKILGEPERIFEFLPAASAEAFRTYLDLTLNLD